MLLIISFFLLLFSISEIRNIRFTKIGIIGGVLIASSLYIFSGISLKFADLLPLFETNFFPVIIFFLFARELFFRGFIQKKAGIVGSGVIYAILAPFLISNSFFEYLMLFIYSFITGVILGMFREKYGLLPSIISYPLYAFFLGISSYSKYFSSITLSLFFLLFPFFWYISLGKEEIPKRLGLISKSPIKNILLGVGCTFLILFFMFFLSLLFSSAGVNDQEKIREKLLGIPPYLRISAITLAPIAEEIFFRGFLIPYTGIFFSSVLFAAAHIGYGSVIEIIGAFISGVIFSLIYKHTKSIIPGIISHSLLNFIFLTITEV